MTQTAELSSKRTTAIPANLIFVLIAGVFAIASSSIFIRFAQGEGISSLLIGAARLVISTLVITPVVLTRHREDLRTLKRNDLALAMVSGLFLAIHFAAWVSSLEYTSVLVSTVVVTASSIWVAILEFFFLKARLTRPIILGLVITIFGGVVIALGSTTSDTLLQAGDNNRHFIGLLLALIGSIAGAVYFAIGRKLRGQLPVIPYIWLVYGCGGICMSIVVLLARIPVLGYEPVGYVWLLCCALIPQLIGHSSLNYAVGYLPATLVSMITQTEPIGSAILAFILFREAPLPVQLLGSAILLAGVMLASYAQSKPTSKIIKHD